jgi:hypothetical protein
MSRRGPMSIADHRDWVAKYGEWTPPKSRPGDRLVEHVMGQLATALGRSEAEIVDDVIARADYTTAERARLERWARQTLTLLILTAERVGSSGTQLSDNVLFHELATRFSPAYAEALKNTAASIPSEMKPSTLEAARDDIKALGLRLQAMFDFAAEAVAPWYEVKATAKGRRLRPLKGRGVRPPTGEMLNEARKLVGLPPVERANGYLLRADDPRRPIHRRIETTDQTILEQERVLGRDVLLASPPTALDSYVLIADAKVTAETEFEPIRSRPRSRAVVNILDQARLRLNAEAARAELERLEGKLQEAKAAVAAVIQPHRKVKEVTTIKTRQFAGDTGQTVETYVLRDGKLVRHDTVLKQMKRAPKEDTIRERVRERRVWDPSWSTAEIAALEKKDSYEQQYNALEPVVNSLEGEAGCVIQTQHRQAINRRWYPTSFWMENLPGDSSTQREHLPEILDAEGVVEEGPVDRVTKARGRLFRAVRKSEKGWTILSGNEFEGVDVSSSQYQILAVLLNDRNLEEALAAKSAHQIAAERVYPGNPDGADRAKLILVAGGYGSAPDRISWKKHIPVDEVQRVLGSLSPAVEKYLEYTREVAYAVDPVEGFTFTDPFDGSEVVWHPIVANETYVKSDKVQIVTYVPADGGSVNRKKLSQQIAPMLIHTLDSAFSGLVVEGLHRRGVKDIVALFDCWLIPSHFLSEYEGNPYLFDEVIAEAGAAWLPMLGPIYDALLEYKETASEPEWMESLREAWRERVKEGRWPQFRTKRVTTYGYE